jgi:hypothetical protein
MKEKEYQLVGWSIFALTMIIALSWCLNETGLTGWLIRSGESLLNVRLVQISWLITVLVICLPGFMAKRYFDNLAWNEHLKSLPQPNPRDSAKRSKYITPDVAAAPQPPKPVELSSLPADQEEFIATCAACGHFFSAKKSNTDLKCPQCGEPIAL